MDVDEIFFKTVASPSFPRYGQTPWKRAIAWLVQNSGLDQAQIINLLNGKFPRWAADRFARGREHIPDNVIPRYFHEVKAIKELYSFW